jgi:hypothetical protein
MDLEKLKSWEGIKVSRSDPMIKRIIESTFPKYSGRKINLRSYTPRELHSYWDEGSKDSYAIVNTQTGAVGHLDSNHPLFEQSRSPIGHKFELPALHILVQNRIFMGKNSGITLFVNESDIFALEISDVQ